MSDVAHRYRRVAGTFTETARRVPADAWDDPAPCEGWVARDVVGHMVEWMPGFLATAAGFEVTLDPDEVHALLTGMESMDEVLRASGHYGPRVDVPADADEQTRLIAFTGRRP